MFRFFKKKKRKSLNDEIVYISDNDRVNFQLDILRNNQVDIQITRQSSLDKFGIKDYENPNGIAYLLTFNSEKDKNQLNEQRFLNSSLSKETRKLDILGNTYVIFSDNDYDSMISKIDQIGNEVYAHDYKQSHSFRFNRIN